jgi:hypothetical protein
MAEVVRLAPIAAAVLFLSALIGRLAGWPAYAAVLVLLVAAAVLGTLFVIRRQSHGTPDAIASRVDADAALGGELRSAHWFALSERRDEWADYHLARAADRARGVQWDALYPAVPSGRAWLVSGALAVAALAVAFVGPGPRAPRPSDVLAEQIAALGDALPPELQARLDQLLASMDNGSVTTEGAAATLEDLKALMDRFDPKLTEKLAELAKNQPFGEDATTKQKNLDEEDLNERKDNSAAGMPEDVKWALEDLAARLANANANRETAENNPSASSETGETAKGSAQAEAAQAAAQEAGMQLMRQSATAAEAAASQMMSAGAGAQGGDSSSGAGGNSPNPGGEVDFKSIAQALRQEIIEANEDILGKNIQTEDIRRKTEQGQSTLGFTRAAPQGTYDRSRATAPPTVPDARRPLLFNYFIRQR